MLDVREQSFQTLVANRHYSIPLYQRPYRWGRANWENLFDDILQQTRIDAQQHAHYLGSMTFKSSKAKSRSTSVISYEVIDGQQRLTTLTLFVAALRAHAIHLKEDAGALGKLLESFIRNTDESLYGIDNAKVKQVMALKVSSLDSDWEAYSWAMRCLPPEQGKQYAGHNIYEGYKYFHNEIKKFLGSTRPQREGEEGRLKVVELLQVLQNNLLVVAVQLDGSDNVHQIFDTLNNRGIPLTEADKIKNLLFMNNPSSQKEVERDYELYWRDFENNRFWSTKRKKGAENQTFFLYMYLLHTGSWKRVPQYKHLYDAYTAYLDERLDAIKSDDELTESEKADQIAAVHSELLQDIHRQSEFFYRHNHQPKISSREDEFIELVTGLEDAIWAVLLWLEDKKDIIPASELLKVYDTLEAWIVRRKLVGLINTFNGIAMGLLPFLLKLADEDLPELNAKLVQWIAERQADQSRNPTDREIEDALLNTPIEENLAKSVLVTLEDHKRGARSSQSRYNGRSGRVHRDVTIEHIMPQSWQENWAITDKTQDAKNDRNRIVGTLGNLTLLDREPNSGVRNTSWANKKLKLAEYKEMELTSALLNENHDIWDESQIRKRSSRLTADALTIWRI